MEGATGVKRLHAPTSLFHGVKGFSHGCWLALIAIGDASGGQVLHPNDRDPTFDVGGIHPDDVVVFGAKHRVCLREHVARGEAGRIEALGCALTVESSVFFEPDLPEETSSEARDLLVRHGLLRKEGYRRNNRLPAAGCCSLDGRYIIQGGFQLSIIVGTKGPADGYGKVSGWGDAPRGERLLNNSLDLSPPEADRLAPALSDSNRGTIDGVALQEFQNLLADPPQLFTS